MNYETAASTAPSVRDSRVEIRSVESPRCVLAVLLADRGGACADLRIRVQHVLDSDHERRVLAEPDAGFHVDDRPTVEKALFNPAGRDEDFSEPAVPVIPAAVVAEASEQLDSPDPLVDPDAPSRSRQRVGVLGNTPRVQQTFLVVGHLGVGVVEDEAENRVAAQRERRIGRNDVDALRRRIEGVGEEPESPQVPGAVDALSEQAVDLVVGQAEVAGDADAVGDVHAEVVGREIDRTGVEDHARGVVDRTFRLERKSSFQRRNG